MAVTATRQSAGIYRVTDGKTTKTINAKDSASAIAAFGKSSSSTPAKPKTPATPATPSIVPKVDYSNPNSVAEGQAKINQTIAKEDTRLANPNEVTDYGSKTVTYDANGNPTITTSLSGANKNLYEQQQETGTLGSQIAGNLLGNFNYNPNGVDTAYQDAAYSGLTRGLEDRYGRDKESKAQELVNRGIPQGSPQFQQEMDQLEQSYDQMRSSAQSQAYTQARTNYDQSFGNKIAWAQAGQGLGTVRDYTGQPYQSAQTSPVDITGIYNTSESAKQSKAQIAAQERIARSRAGGGGGGGGASTGGVPAVDI